MWDSVEPYAAQLLREESGNVVIDVHDYMAHCTNTDPNCEGRQYNGNIYVTTQGGPMISRGIRILNTEYPHYKYGRDYVNLGFRPGNEGVIAGTLDETGQDPPEASWGVARATSKGCCCWPPCCDTRGGCQRRHNGSIGSSE